MTAFDEFLNSSALIDANQAEYSILFDLYNTCPDKIFLFELPALDLIKQNYGDVSRYINENYKSFDVRCFSVDRANNYSFSIILEQSGSSISDETLFNHAINISRRNESYVLVRARDAYALLSNGEFDDKFHTQFVDRRKLFDMEREKLNIDQLEQAFEHFHVERKHRGCDYITGGKVSNSVSEQQLRNHLIKYLKRVTNMNVLPELCTSEEKDEESVDIGVINADKVVAIIEVKYFVKRGFFEDSKKAAYSPSRFLDGYKQLNRYCIHLDKDNYTLHSAYLYMFYAHSETEAKLQRQSKEYLDSFASGKDCGDEFRCHYKSTILDNMMDIRCLT